MNKNNIIKTGIAGLDSKIGGLDFGSVTILAGDSIGISRFIRKLCYCDYNLQYNIETIKHFSDKCRKSKLCGIVVYTPYGKLVKSANDIPGIAYDIAENVLICDSNSVLVRKSRTTGIYYFRCSI